MKMKILHFFLVSNFLFAAIGGTTFGIVADSSTAMFVICLIGAAIAIVGLSVLISRQFAAGLQTIEQAVATAQGGEPSQIEELEATRQKLHQYVQRWAVAANRSRTQNKTIDWLVETLERRCEVRDANATTDAGIKLQSILTGITSSADDCLQQIVDSVEQVQSAISAMSDVTISQSTEATKSTSHVEHLSQSMMTIASASDKAHESGQSVSSTIGELAGGMSEHLLATRRIQAGVESGESRLRAMLDHVREIGAIASSIADISSRTDMLALNLSIESARQAGGSRGSSNVAEEVRRLAEQAAQAAQEVNGLVESVQIETQESIATIAQQNKDLETELNQVQLANNRLAEMANDAANTATHLKAIGKASEGQIRLSAELVAFVEEIAKHSRESREQSESAIWNAGSLATAIAQVDKLFDPLRAVAPTDQTRQLPKKDLADHQDNLTTVEV